MHTNRAPFFQNQGTSLQNSWYFFSVFKKGQGIPPPTSCASGVEGGNRNLENHALNVLNDS